MSNITYTYSLVNGTTASATEVMQNFNDVKDVVNGNIELTNLSAGLQAQIASGGSSLIATSQSTNSTTFTTLTTPDRVSITVAATSILYISFRADLVMNNTSAQAQTTIYIGSSQAQGLDGGVVQNDYTSTTTPKIVYTDPVQISTGYLTYVTGTSAAGYGAAPFIPVVVAAGTYDVEARFKLNSSGTSLSASNRALYVKAESFA